MIHRLRVFASLIVILLFSACGQDPGNSVLDLAPPDAAPREAGAQDAAPLDAVPLDIAPLDVAPPDAAPLDAAPLDTAPPDAALPDAALPDAKIGTHRRRKIQISASAGAGKGYQVRLLVGQSAQASGADTHLGGQGRADFADIRFTASDGSTKLPHWLEGTNGTAPHRTATFWVRIAADLSTSQAIFIYYGEPTAKSATSGAATFHLYDDLETPFSSGKTALSNAKSPLTTPTYDGSGQAIHPDIVHFPKGWNGYKYWMAMTPYPGSNDQLENPSLLASNDGQSWISPLGLKAPLAPAPPCDHNNDTEMVYNPVTDELWVYYQDTRRASRCASHKTKPYYDHNYVQLIRVGRSGAKWTVSAPAISLDQDLATETLLLSPTVVRLNSTKWHLWMSDVSNKVHRFDSADGIKWTNKTPLKIADKVWHLNVDWIPSASEFWMLSDYPTSKGSIRWATSKDGLTWTTFPGLMLDRQPSLWDANLYRGCFLYDPTTDLLRVWYSAYKSGPTVWGTGHTQRKYGDMIKQLKATPAGGWGTYQQGGSWASSMDLARRGSRSGKLVQSSTSGKMIVHKALPLGTGFVLEWDLYDDLDTSAFKLIRVDGAVLSAQAGVGVWTGASTTHYAFHDDKYKYTTTTAVRTKGWHKLGIRVESQGLTFLVDGKGVGSQVSPFSVAKAVSVEGFNGGLTTFYVDDLRVRKVSTKEPKPGPPGPEQKGTWAVF